MNDWAVIIVVYLALFISSPLIAILHESGHAFAYLLLTKPDKIDIYIGTYCLPKNGIKIKIGKLHYYVKRSFPFVKGIGLCKSDKAETSYLNFIIILLAGPIFTFVIAAVIGVIILNSDAHLLIKIAFYIFLALSFLSLLTNLIPRRLDSINKTNLNSDGEQIIFTLRIKKALPDYITARQQIADKQFELAVISLKKIWVKVEHEKIIRLLVFTSLQAKQFDETEQHLNVLERKFKLLPDDIFYRGCLQSFTKKHDDAITTYSKVLKLDRHHLFALNNIGLELIEKGAHQVAKRALDKAIKLSPKFDAPYGNSGYSLILQGDFENGKVYVDKCLKLNPENAEAYKSLGIYYLRQKEINLSQENFSKAIELDETIDLGNYTHELDLLLLNG